MQHKVRVIVIKKNLDSELQKEFCADPLSGVCPCYNVGDVFIFERYGDRDDYWHCGLNTLKATKGNPDLVAGGPKIPFCSEAWDAISRYIYTGLQGGSIMRGWMERENEMIACCNDGTRPVVFKIERLDYYAIHLEEKNIDQEKVKTELMRFSAAKHIDFAHGFIEFYVDVPIEKEALVKACSPYKVARID